MRWELVIGTIAVLPVVGGAGYGAADYFATKAELQAVADRAEENKDDNFRLEQLWINSQRKDREERGLKANPEWLQQQQRSLDYRRCIRMRALNPKDKTIRCDR